MGEIKNKDNAQDSVTEDLESENKGRLMILSYELRMFANQFPMADLLGYKRTKDGDLIIQPKEAKTVH